MSLLQLYDLVDIACFVSRYNKGNISFANFLKCVTGRERSEFAELVRNSRSVLYVDKSVNVRQVHPNTTDLLFLKFTEMPTWYATISFRIASRISGLPIHVAVLAPISMPSDRGIATAERTPSKVFKPNA